MKLKKLLQRITILLVVSIVLNLYLVYRLGRTEQRLTQRINHAISEARRTSDDISSLYRQLRQLREEQEWLVQADFVLNDVSAEGALLTGTFDFRSATPGAQVILQIRSAKENDWPADYNTSLGIASEAKLKKQNEWQDFPAEPQTELTYQAKFLLSPDENYEYRLVSRNQNAILASPIEQLPPEVYRRPSLMPQMSWKKDGSGKLTSATIELCYQYEPSPFPAFKPVSATLEIIQENGAITTHEFAAGPYHEKVPFVLEDITDLPPDAQLMAAVRYADGYTMNVHIGGTNSKGVPNNP